MDNKIVLINLIEKYRDLLRNNHDYIVCNQVLEKISSSMIMVGKGEKIEFDELVNLNEEEISIFSSSRCLRIIKSFRELPGKIGWSIEGALNLIKELETDILQNKMKDFLLKEDYYNKLQNIVEEGLFKDNYNLVLEFIKMSVDNMMISHKDGIGLNFYLLKLCYSLETKKDTDDIVEEVILVENLEPDTDIREKLYMIFNKYEYQYDPVKMGNLDEKFVKYCNLDYLDYVLSKFKDFGVTLDLLYSRKQSLYTIVILNDKETFDELLNFVDKNNCSLNSILCMPSVFAKRKRNYVERSIRVGADAGSDNIYTIYGTYQDFLHNMELYKKLAKVDVVTDNDLNKIGVFLCTPAKLINKNLNLLNRYCIISDGELPKAITSLCGKNTEFIIDRMIELGLFESYLSPKVTLDGVKKQPRGTYFLDSDSSLLKFYKMKRANDVGNSIFASNGGIKRIFKDNLTSYMGISYDNDGNICQEPLSIEEIEKINLNIRKELPIVLQHQFETGKIPMSEAEYIQFNNLYKYKVFSPIEVFNSSDKKGITNLKGDSLNSLFNKDFKHDYVFEEFKSIALDNFIKILDNAVYCSVSGDSRPLKVSEFKYEFMHPSFPNIRVSISRYKVLRLCKLLKENGLWINNESHSLDKENTLLSVVLKDSILCETEMTMLRFAIRGILNNGLIKVSVDSIDTKSGRGAR